MIFFSRCSKCHTFIFAKSLVKDRFLYIKVVLEKREKALYLLNEKHYQDKKNFILNCVSFDQIIFFDNTEYVK